VQTLTKARPGLPLWPAMVARQQERSPSLTRRCASTSSTFRPRPNQIIGRQLWNVSRRKLSRFSLGWSPDSRLDRLGAGPGYPQLGHCPLRLQNPTSCTRSRPVSTTMSCPCSIPTAKYLFFRTGRNLFAPSYSELDSTWIYANSSVLAAVPLRKDVLSPLAPRNDEGRRQVQRQEGRRKEGRQNKKDNDKKSDEKKSPTRTRARTTPATGTKKDKKKEEKERTKKEERGQAQASGGLTWRASKSAW